MRIVSVNAWGGAMFDALAAWLPGVGADVVCLQEVTRIAGRNGWTTFEDGERQLPQRADLFDDVSALLPGHDAAFVASDAGPVVAPDGAVHLQQFGLGQWVAGRIPIVGTRAGFVHGRYAANDTWATSERPRVAQGVRTVEPGSDRPVVVLHVHGLRDTAGKGDTPARRRQAERLVRLVDDLRVDGDLVVVCGDFNLLPDSETFQVLAAAGLTDLVRDADTRTSRYTKPVRHASYLLVSDPDAVQRFEIVTSPEVSDHRALLLDV